HTDLLPYVKRNLDLMPAYVEPDGTIFTLKSTRQDSGQTMYPYRYYANYLEYGWLAKDPAYRARGISLLNEAAVKGLGESRNMLTRVLLYPEIIDDLPAAESFEKRTKYFNPIFGLYRDIRGSHSLTAAAGSSRFMKFQKGANSVMLRLSATFFGSKGKFIPTEISKIDENSVKLHQTSVWGYTRPFDQPQASPVWADMDWSTRERAYMQSFDVDAHISISDDRVSLKLEADGPKDMLYRIELIFPAGGFFETDSASIPGTAGSGGILKTAECRYRLGNDSIQIAGGFAEHLRGQALRGGEPQDTDAFTLYCTGYIPDKRLLVIS
ncbi:MAG: hypothetical protein HN368_01300, partial [Spirochaetales bacterium]|nr:hypothetical protein [Spirochaetales bacterium]